MRRSRPRGCPTRSSSTATRSRRWRACERCCSSRTRAARGLPPPLARDPWTRAQAAGPGRAAAALPRERRPRLHRPAVRHRRDACPAAAGQARDRPGHHAEGHRGAEPRRRRLRDQRARLLGRVVRADVPCRLGRAARAPGPAHPALRAPPDAVRRVLLAPPGRRDHLAAHERRAGARPARLRRRRDAVRLQPDAARHRGDPALARRTARAADLPHLPRARHRVVRVPHRLGRRLPDHAREDRGDHGLPAGDAVRDPGGAGLRSGAPPRAPLRRAQRRQPRREHEDGLPQRRVLPRRRAAVRARHGRHPALRRHPGAPGRRHDRRARRLRGGAEQLLRPDPAALAALHDLPGGHGRAGQDLRAARRGAGPRRPPRRDPPRPPARRDRVRRRRLPLRRRGDRRRHVPHQRAHPAGPDRRAGGRDGGGQVDLRQARRAVLRPDGGQGARGRARPARRQRRVAALADGHRAAGSVPVQRHDRGQHRLRPRRRLARGGRGGGARGRRPRVHPRARARLRHGGRRARRAALGRPAAVDRVRARADRRPPDPRPRRGDLERRHPHREPHRARPAAPARRPHRDRHRAPALDHPACRAHPRARPRARRRAGHPRGAAGGAGRVLEAVPRLGGAGGGIERARLRWASLGLALLVAVLHFALRAGFTIDDAAISYAYAHNFATGHGLGVLTPGDFRVEGYSNFTWVMLLAGADALGADIEGASKALGLVGLLAAVWLLHRILWAGLRERRLAFGLVLVPLGVSTVLWSASGLENGLYVFLLVLAAWALMREDERVTPIPWMSAVVLCLAALTRPDGVVYAAAALAFMAARAMLARRSAPGELRPRLRAMGAWCVVFGFAFGGYLAWHHAFYGALFTNTTYAKIEGGGVMGFLGNVLDPLSAGWRYIGRYFVYHAGAGLLVGAVAGAWALARRREAVLALFALASLALPLYQPDWMVHFRFLSVFAAFGVPLALLGLDAALARRREGAGPRWLPAAAVAGLAAFAVVNVAQTAAIQARGYHGWVTDDEIHDYYAGLGAAAATAGVPDPLM